MLPLRKPINPREAETINSRRSIRATNFILLAHIFTIPDLNIKSGEALAGGWPETGKTSVISRVVYFCNQMARILDLDAMNIN
jgi:hypothetical protein